ncbi:hypothetical protein HYPSUDRAFT_431298 [Hypholoma sublateritium FD-334 SS-4]|uniref:Uncharacterized protein n=1 Tax=Hypholoma sublateritium (strain FD-334 SS-4) TaxID=945553 RepID=A0A0D2ND54_HYPSF|nr:hypothetical protein HYPSUDRAFT_431298 [Hypholoma sublateritium FD-334 SS-4]
MCHLLDDNWPAEESVWEIVNKSSGQFIYASVVMNFLSLPRAHPAHQLEIVRGLRPSGLSTPFAHLDALYRHILSQMQDTKTTTEILAYTILGKRTNIVSVANFFDVPTANVHVALSDLASVIACKGRDICFLHASLPDFLLDQARSREYHISTPIYATDLSIMWFKNVSSGRFSDYADRSIANLLPLAKATPKLRESILTFDPYKLDCYVEQFYPMYLNIVCKMELHDGGWLYRRQLNVILRFLRKTQRYSMVADMLEQRDSLKILGEIDREEAESMKALTSTNQSQDTCVQRSELQPRVIPKPMNRNARIRTWIKSLLK